MRPVTPFSARYENSRSVRHDVHSGDALMCLAATPAASNWRRLASTRSRKIFLGSSLWPGARAVRKEQGILLADRVRLLNFVKQFASVLELGFKLASHFRTDRVAATVNPGANGCPEITGRRAEAAMHLAHALFDDTFDGPAPSRMEHAHGATSYVHQDYRQAIGGQNSQQAYPASSVIRPSPASADLGIRWNVDFGSSETQ